MKLFLDTEFTDFTNPELISIGIVDENGREFYAERNDFPRELCSDFVRETVLPLLGQYPPGIVGTKRSISHALSSWLREYSESGMVICVDYQTDWDLFLDLLDGSSVLEFAQAQMIWKDLDLERIEAWWEETQLPRHMALYDARANKHGYTANNQH
jgi:hypothetical protein